MTDDKIKELFELMLNKVKELNARVKALEAEKQTSKTSSLGEEVVSDDKTDTDMSYRVVTDAPEWNVYYKVNTSEGIYNHTVRQQAWTEKQAMFLGRTEQLFKHMNELVKLKQIQAKWSILDIVVEKI